MYGYYCASSKTVNYYLDPRNSLIESSVFQFLDLSNSVTLSKETIQNIVAGTYLANYVDTIIEAANQSGVNPLHIIVTIYQELGKKEEIPKAISGTIAGYEGLYNFYNYGSNDGDGAVERGLEKARGMGWTTPEYALIDGAVKVLKGGYISAGQTTKYFYKFDVVGNDILADNETKTYSIENFYSHQYMTNIQDPTSQAGMLMEYYTNYGLLDSNLTFTIPVYNNMPETAVSFPTTLTEAEGDLYYVNTIHVVKLAVRDTVGNEIGKLTKNQIVAVQSIENNVATLKLKVVTGIGTDENGKAKWNYEDKIVYLRDASYLVKCETISIQTPIVNTTEFKVEESNLKMTPTVSVTNIKDTYPNAIIRKADGTDISDTEEQIGTGYKIIIDEVEYTAIKYGDINGDGTINSGDLLRLQKHFLQVINLENTPYILSSDANKDNNVNSGDLLKIQKFLLQVTNIEI